MMRKTMMKRSLRFCWFCNYDGGGGCGGCCCCCYGGYYLDEDCDSVEVEVVLARLD